MERPPSCIGPTGQPSWVDDADAVRELARWIVAVDRERPIVVLTVRPGGRDPYFAPSAVQRLVGRDGDVVAIEQSPKGRLTRELARALPDGLMVFGGAARIYWPPALVGVDPDAHPLVRANSDDSSSAEKRARLSNRWRQGPDETRRPTAVADAAPAGVGEEVQVAIVRAWLELFDDVDVRDRFPLQPYRVDQDLAEQLAALEPARAPVAAAAARILSGYAWTEPAPVPERVEVDGAPVLRPGDRAVAWRYPLVGSDQVLHYWQPASGPAVLARIGARDRTGGALAPREAVDPTSTPATPAAHEVEPADAPRRPSPRAPRLEIADEDLVRVLRAAGKPLLAPELRAALGIDSETPRERFSKILGDAAARGVIERTGQRRGTRYSAT
ncbi:hypothetical protein AB0L40_13115 [Patulibacter sp. NPDC049589]|uniref:hypothetical protein n=1 Tax=Patulibacter sp. NPDC049589 TaxID=3154731 RepID=UPI003426634E